MKLDVNNKDAKNALYIFFVIAASIVFLFIIKNLSGIFAVISTIFQILSPFVWGFAIAYLLNRPMRFFEKHLFVFLSKKKPHPQLTRSLSIALVILIFLGIVVGLIWIILPQLLSNIFNLIGQLPKYIDSFTIWLGKIAKDFGLNIDISSLSLDQLLENVLGYTDTIIPQGINTTIRIVSELVNVFLGLVACVYFLYSKEKFIAQVKKLMFAVFPKEFTRKTIRLTRETHAVFSGFIMGKLLESLVVIVLNFIVLSIANIPYALLISVIMGVFNIIPFFGPFIGAIPSVILLLMVDPNKALWFVILTVIMEQVVGQVIGPKILSNTTGLAAFWVIFAIILGGGMFGVLGMIFGIPVFAIIYTLFAEFINMRLKKKGLSTNSEDYHTEKP